MLWFLIYTCFHRIISGRPLSVYRMLPSKTNTTVTFYFYSWETLMSPPLSAIVLPHFKPPVSWHRSPLEAQRFAVVSYEEVFCDISLECIRLSVPLEYMLVCHYRFPLKKGDNTVYPSSLPSVTGCFICSPLYFFTVTGTCLPHSWISVKQPIHYLCEMWHAQHLLVMQKGRLVGKMWELVFKPEPAAWRPQVWAWTWDTGNMGAVPWSGGTSSTSGMKITVLLSLAELGTGFQVLRKDKVLSGVI